MKFRSEGAGITLAFFLVILGAAAVLAILQRKVEGKPYDERQIHGQRQAAQWGFFTMVGLGLTGCLLLDLFETELSHELVLRSSLYLGTGVYCGVAIWKDAYVPMTQSWGKVLLALGMWTVWQWMRLAGDLEGLSLSAADTDGWSQMILLVVYTLLTALLAVKWLLLRREEKAGD